MAELSPFHTELLDFLQTIAKQRVKEEGFSLEQDPQLLTFQKALHNALLPTSTDAPLPLAEILDHYQHLFEVRGPLHVERNLLQIFSQKEFADLGIEKAFPKIYRGLPRLYHRGTPARSHIKKNFTHLPTLARLAVEKAIVQLYEKKIPPKGARIVLFTWILSDGWGDVHAAIHILKVLKKQLPGLCIDWIALAPESYSLPEQPSYLIRYDKEPSLSLFPKEAFNLFSSADLILQFPTHYPHTSELVQSLDRPRFVSIGEYGFLESSWFHPRTGNRSMGLHFLEKGILTPETAEKKWADLENKQLLQWMKKKHDAHFYLAYLSTVSGGMVYLHALFKSLEEDERNIDLCVPDLRWFIRSLEEQKQPLLKHDFGIRLIEVYFEDEVHTLKIEELLPQGKEILRSGKGRRVPRRSQIDSSSELPVQKKGKKVRLFSPSHLSHRDFQTLLSLSGEFVAVRGNQSFSEAVAANKVFFYDGREHSRYFMKDLLALAAGRLKACPNALTVLRGMGKAFLHNLPSQEGEWVDEIHFQEKQPLLDIALEIGAALKHPDTLAGFQKLNAILKEEHSFEKFLIPFILRELCHARSPDIAQYEETHLELFSTSSCSLTTLIAAIRKRLYTS